jgi:mono/diheme cytochrome c family protein
MADNARNQNESKLVGLLAQFDDPDQLIHACNAAREDGYRAMDAYTPFPLHGIDEALGIRRTLLPFFVLAVGIGACFLGIGLQWYTNSTDDWWPFPGYAFRISGKPMFSLPANIPVAFEIIVLSSAFATFFGMWIRNGYPRFAHPLHRISRFKRVTDDRFFFMIEARDEKFNEAEVREKFAQWGATEIDECRLDQTDQQMPPFVKTALVCLVVLSFVPPVLVYRARGMTNRLPRLHFMPDMDWQEKYKAQSFGPTRMDGQIERPFFADERSMRPTIEGTIAKTDLEKEDLFEYFNGYVKGTEPKVGLNARTSLASSPEKPGPTQDEGSAQNNNSDAQENDAQEDQDNKTDADPNQEQAESQQPAPPEPQWVTTFPSNLKIDEQFVRRGKARFEIYCSACHGFNGDGNGLVNQRAMGLNFTAKATWTTAKSLHDPEVVKQDVGRIFDTITHGRSTMGPYGRQIPVEDRWAIVTYVKALQAQGATRNAFDPNQNKQESGATAPDSVDAGGTNEPTDNQN